MKYLLLAILCAAVTAPAGAVTVTLAPAVLAQNTLPTLVTTCAGPNAPAGVDAAYFQAPAIATEQGVTGISQVQIALDERGRLTSERLFASSGNAYLDGASMRSARMSQYTAERRDCARVGGTYLLSVEY